MPHTPSQGPLLDPEKVRRILVCQLRQIGDVLLTTPSIELLAQHFPHAEIHVFTEKKCVPMLENNPHVHTIWPVDKKKLRTLVHELAFYRRVTAKGFDLVVDFQQLPRCRWVVAFSGAKVRLSFPPPWYNRWLYTHWAGSGPAYAAAYKAAALTPLGISWHNERPRLYLTDAERQEARELLCSLGLEGLFTDSQDKPRLISVDATHRHATRQWPARHYAALMDLAVEKDPSLYFFLPYGPGREEEHVRSIHAASRHPEHIIIPPGLISLRLMAACMAESAMHIGNCSAPRHMAVGVGIPTMTILGATSTGWTFPSPEHTHIRAQDFMDMPCQPCNKNTCPYDLRCLVKLTPEMVLPHFLSHLEQYGQ